MAIVHSCQSGHELAFRLFRAVLWAIAAGLVACKSVPDSVQCPPINFELVALAMRAPRIVVGRLHAEPQAGVYSVEIGTERLRFWREPGWGEEILASLEGTLCAAMIRDTFPVEDGEPRHVLVKSRYYQGVLTMDQWRVLRRVRYAGDGVDVSPTSAEEDGIMRMAMRRETRDGAWERLMMLPSDEALLRLVGYASLSRGEDRWEVGWNHSEPVGARRVLCENPMNWLAAAAESRIGLDSGVLGRAREGWASDLDDMRRIIIGVVLYRMWLQTCATGAHG